MFFLNQGGNPVKMFEMLRTDVNVSGLACHGVTKVPVKGCRMLWFSNHPNYPNYLLFCTRYIIAIILSHPVSIYIVD